MKHIFACCFFVFSAAAATLQAAEPEKAGLSAEKTSVKSVFLMPEPSLKHLRELTDNTGMFEFATGLVPNRENGYCTEDIARALAAVLLYNRHVNPVRDNGRFARKDGGIRPPSETSDLYPRRESGAFSNGVKRDVATAAALAKIYLSYLERAQMKDGDFYHRMDYKQQSHGTATEDSYGRALWGLGYAAAYPVDEAMGIVAGGMFEKALPRAKKLKWPRSMAYSMLGLHYYLERFPENADARALMKTLADQLVRMYKKNSSGDWPWFETILTYDNAKMPHALFLAYEDVKNREYLDTAVKTLDFLIKVSFPQGDMLRIVGNKGWYPKGGKPALYDQQPTDAAAMVEACAAAYRITDLIVYKEKTLNAFEWFLGNNINGTPVYDAASGGSHDGLNESGVNENEGAESSIAVVNSLLTLKTMQGLE